MSDLTPEITEEMIEQTARDLALRANPIVEHHWGTGSVLDRARRLRSVVETRGWDSREYPEVQRIVAEIAAGLSAALAGRAVVALPDPTGTDEDGKYWSVEAAGHEYYGYVSDGLALVSMPYDDMTADEAEADALARLAAAREARLLAAQPQAGDPR